MSATQRHRLAPWLLLAVASLAAGCGGSSEPEPAAPRECLLAWRAEKLAPTHCEEYPEAYQAIQRELERLKGG
jgi:hypothetical protein